MSLLTLARKLEVWAWLRYAKAPTFDQKLLDRYNKATCVRERLELKELHTTL